MRRLGVETAVLLLAAGAGTVLAHSIDYAAVFPRRAARTHALLATGHGYWHLAVLAGTAAGLAAAALAVARGGAAALAQRPGDRCGSADGTGGYRALDVVVVQVGAFAGLELL